MLRSKQESLLRWYLGMTCLFTFHRLWLMNCRSSAIDFITAGSIHYIFKEFKILLFCRLLSEKSRRTKEMSWFVYMQILVGRSLFLEHFLLRNSHRSRLTWCLKKILSYPTTGKMGVCTFVDIKLLIQWNILFMVSFTLHSHYSLIS